MSYSKTEASLQFFRGEESLLQLKMDRTEVRIGRAITNDVVVPDPEVPEMAAKLSECADGGYTLHDFSGGALRVNDRALGGSKVHLRLGDRIHLGAYVLAIGEARQSASGRERRTHRMSREPRSTRRAWLRWGEQLISLDEEQPFSIGSEADNDLVIQDSFVSGYHCRLAHADHVWRITDLDSTNGTRVNGLRVKHAELVPKVMIELGPVQLEFIEQVPRATRQTFGLVAESTGMRDVLHLVERFAESPEPVLVLGESGTGKEGIARALHDASSRIEHPYIALNCGALASSIIESELFGHVKGAFTGATTDKKGAFEAASGGTLFLDEIGELPLALQPKLLRVLETQRVRKVGSTSEFPIQTRIVAATHKNLSEAVAEGRFREDLFHRLFVLSLMIPPLRERPEDVRALIDYFLRSDTTVPRREISPAAMQVLLSHEWPGNVRELRNVLVRALLIAEGQTITPRELQFSTEAFETKTSSGQPTKRALVSEKARMLEALDEAGGNRAAAARALGVSKSTFYDRLRRLGL